MHQGRATPWGSGPEFRVRVGTLTCVSFSFIRQQGRAKFRFGVRVCWERRRAGGQCE
jgi:hypothetical protein